MLWFGSSTVAVSGRFTVFKNILCYGSAKRIGLLNFVGMEFKNILCYGSAVFTIVRLLRFIRI